MTDLNQCSINNNLQQENNELRQKLEDASTSNQALDVYKNVINAAYNIGDSKANKEKEIERLKKLLEEAINNEKVAPSQVYPAWKKWCDVKFNTSTCDELRTKYLNEKANKIIDEYNEKFELDIKKLELLLETYNNLTNSLSNIEKYNTTLIDGTKYGKEESLETKQKIFINDRKTYYENQNYNLVNNWNNLFGWIYWLLVIIFALSLFLVKNSLTTKMKGIIILGVILYYFLAKNILFYFLKLLFYLYNLLPKNVYTSL